MLSTTEQPLVSIIIPVYNGRNFLAKAIDSALAQTYPHIEVLVVNDGSNDNGKTAEIMSGYGNKIRAFHKENGGVSTALNLGIREMKGEYFSWLSHDDMYYPHKISTQIAQLQQHPGQKIIPYSNYDVIDGQDAVIGANRIPHELVIKKPFYSVMHGYIHGCSLLIPKECFTTHGPFNESLRTAQDSYQWFKFSRTHIFFHTTQRLIRSRSHGEQGSNQVIDHRERDTTALYMISHTTQEQMLSCEKTEYVFYTGMEHFYKRHDIMSALDHARHQKRGTFMQHPIYNFFMCILPIELPYALTCLAKKMIKKIIRRT